MVTVFTAFGLVVSGLKTLCNDGANLKIGGIG